MRHLLNNRLLVIAGGIFFLALLARIFLFSLDYRANEFNLEKTIHGDDGYYELTQGILAGRGFTWETEEPYAPNPLRTPLYPYFAAFILSITNSYSAVIGIQMLVASASAVLAFFIGRKLLSSDVWGGVVGIFMALEPYHIQFSFIFYTETMFIFAFLFFAWWFLRYLEEPTLPHAALAGILLGAATLTKTTVQFLPILLGVFLLWYFRKKIKIGIAHAAIFGAMFLLMISPWLYRNYETFGVIGMSAQPAYNLIVYLVPSVLAIENNVPISEIAFVKEHGIVESDITLATADQYTEQAVEILKQYPEALFKVGLISVFTFFTHDGVLTVLQHAGYTPGSKLSRPALILATTEPVEFLKEIGSRLTTPEGLIIFFRLLNIAIAVLFAIGAAFLLLRRRHSAYWIFALILVAYFMATTPINGLGVNARFRMPVEPLIISIALLPAIALLRRYRHTGERSTYEQAIDSHPLL